MTAWAGTTCTPSDFAVAGSNRSVSGIVATRLAAGLRLLSSAIFSGWRFAQRGPTRKGVIDCRGRDDRCRQQQHVPHPPTLDDACDHQFHSPLPRCLVQDQVHGMDA